VRHVAFLAVAALGLGAPAARAENVALTFDDLPQLSLTDSTDYAKVTTRKLLGGLHRHRMPAIGFVVGDKLEGDDHQARVALLRAWLKAGEPLGNHTYDHASLNKTPPDAYIASLQKDDEVLRPLVGRRARRGLWFRHPYLETGSTLEAKGAVEGWLDAHHYRVAPVTLENSDWMFALPYDEAVLRGDKAEAARIRRTYVDYTARCVRWYRGAARQLLGRQPDLVFLLHSSRINADSLDDIAHILHRNHLKAVSLERAMRDPAYAMSEGPPDPSGDEWLSRWSDQLHKELPWDSFPEPPADIAAADKRLDSEP
jgi:peptidoglycan/xylan/chitin deacetylase (PgdA/CDA1 family)